MLDLDEDAGNVHGASGATSWPNEPALPLAQFNPLYSHHPSTLASALSGLCSAPFVCNSGLFTNLDLLVRCEIYLYKVQG